MHRSNTKPRGYQGDSEMMRMVYANQYSGETLLGNLLHKHILNTPAAQAVRNRRQLVVDELCRLAANRQGNVPLRLMSLACGPAQEIADILGCEADMQAYEVTLFDQDPHALAEARSNIAEAEARCGMKANVFFEQHSVVSLLSSKPTGLRARLGHFDTIYSMGLYDYLSDKLAINLSRAAYDMLKPGGLLLVGNYSVNNPTRTYMQYWGDWPLEYRTEQQMLAMLDPGRSFSVEVGFEPARAQMFLRALKP